MQCMLRTLVLTIGLLVILCLGVPLPPLYAQSRAQPSARPMGIVTGGTKGTYYAIGKDIAKQAEDAGVLLTVKESGGSLDNIRRLISPENVALGIIQSDVLDFLRQSQDRQSLNIAERLGVIFPLYNEEVHLLARREITQVKDLQGKRVVVGVEGSGNWVTATYLLYLLGVEPGERLPLGPQEALEAVLANHTDAMFYVAGKPTPLFKELQQRGSGATDAVHFVSLANKTLQQKSYEPSTIGPQDYPWFSNTVETVAVKALLVGFDFSASDTLYARLRCDTLEKLSKIIRDHLSDLQSQGHPKWQQVKLDAELGPWKRHPCLLPASLRKLPLGIPPRSSR